MPLYFTLLTSPHLLIIILCRLPLILEKTNRRRAIDLNTSPIHIQVLNLRSASLIILKQSLLGCNRYELIKRRTFSIFRLRSLISFIIFKLSSNKYFLRMIDQLVKSTKYHRHSSRFQQVL